MQGDTELDGAIYGRTKGFYLTFICTSVITVNLVCNNEIVEYTPLPFLQSAQNKTESFQSALYHRTIYFPIMKSRAKYVRRYHGITCSVKPPDMQHLCQPYTLRVQGQNLSRELTQCSQRAQSVGVGCRWDKLKAIVGHFGGELMAIHDSLWSRWTVGPSVLYDALGFGD